ncbi:hypothetical protein BRADI_3g53591v3 [Brachypodium distachyon]|uniref:Uncharacterized protein n=1 Tax=Brachypodium distachyon TaxID=15368 RepID=A0A2K2D4W5_BRADI|nr:hypothetical protein BRADI_3g53591v3 [Brachypodium distachyon]
MAHSRRFSARLDLACVKGGLREARETVLDTEQEAVGPAGQRHVLAAVAAIVGGELLDLSPLHPSPAAAVCKACACLASIGSDHKTQAEICGVCGHRPAAAEAVPPAKLDSAFPTQVLKDFLFLGSYDNASRSEVLKTLNITHILNVPFLMKSRGWRVAQCFQWVKDRRPQVLLTEASQGLLVEYEQKLFGPNASILAQTVVLTESFPSLGFGFPEPSGDIQVPAFSQSHVPSIFERAGPNNVPSNFSFGEGIMEVNPSNSGTVTSTSCDNQMDSS